MRAYDKQAKIVRATLRESFFNLEPPDIGRCRTDGVVFRNGRSVFDPAEMVKAIRSYERPHLVKDCIPKENA